MKRVLILLVAAVTVLSALLALSACKKTKLPSTDYEKVAFAFNGVEKSFKDAGAGAADPDTFAVPRLLAGEGDPLSVIRAIYSSGDDQGDVIDELEYTQPPMIQFQCLKAVLEKIGKNFAFGTKYYDDITGTVYFDPTTGESKADDANKDDFKYDYAFRLALRIDIDENDLIKADVSFSIRMTRGNDVISTEWYVGMELDYDMTSTKPIYTLTMKTANDERQLAFRGNYTYEYDYVDVDASGIKEWRKFVLEPDAKLVKDADHQTFESYREAGVNFRADTCKWYYDKSLKKVTRHDPDKDARIADAFYLFGLNSTDIDGQPFLSANGEKNSAITDAYRKFSEIFRNDVIYSLVTEKEDDRGGNGGHGEVVGIRVLTPEGDAWSTQTIENDCTVSDLLSGFAPWGGAVIGVTRPCIWTVDAAGDKVDMLHNFGDYNYTITLGKGAPLSVDLGTRLSTVLANDLGGSAALEQNGFYITIGITDKNNPAYTASFGAIVGFSQEIDRQTAKQFPAALTEMGVPTFDTQNGCFRPIDGKQGEVAVEITTNRDERSKYLDKLTRNGFVKNELNEYVKTVGENVLYVTVSDFNGGSEMTLSARLEKNGGQNSAAWPASTVAGWLDGKITLPEPTGEGTLQYKAGDASAKNLFIYGLTDSEKVAYLNEIAEPETVWITGDPTLTTRTIKFLYEGNYYAIDVSLDYDGAMYFELNLERNGEHPAPVLQVNQGTGVCFAPLTNGRPGYTVTEKLKIGDTIRFLNTNGLPFSETEDFARSQEDPEGAWVVQNSGTYTFVMDGMIEVTKQ